MINLNLKNQGKSMVVKLKKILIILLILLINLSFLPIEKVHAVNASLYLTPSSSSPAIGNNFTIYVGVNSGGNSINAIEATVNIPTSIFSISSAGTGGSLCSIWVQQPTISGSSVSFKCGIPSGTTSSGNLVSISLTASAVGSGSASISGARVLAGPGTNVTGGTSGGSYSVIASSGGSSSGGSNKKQTVKVEETGTPSPVVSSSTHSDQNNWYKNNNVAFSWPRADGITGYSYIFDQNEATVPVASSSNVNVTSLNLPGVADGEWYLHIRANGPKGWSARTNYRVRIDMTAPTFSAITTDPKGESDKRPVVSFDAVDAASGIDHYEIKMDQEEFRKVSSPYTPGSIKSGEHVFTVKAFDKAGNVAEGKVTIRIKEIPVPKITNPQSSATFKLIQSLDIAGTADSTTKVDLYIDGTNIARGLTVKEDGTWKMTYKNFIMPGKHKITAVSVRDGIVSKTSEEVTINIDPSAVSIFGRLVPSVFIFIILLTIIGLLTILIIWLVVLIKRGKDKLRGKFKRNNMEAEEVSKDFTDMERKLNKDIQGTYQENKMLTPKEKHQLEDKIKKDLKSTEKVIIDTIEKRAKDR